MTEPASPPPQPLEAAALTDVGTARDHNEDACGIHWESPTCLVVCVADGVSQSEAGEVASSLAVEATIRAFQAEPATRGAGQRLYRAVQQANIDIYDKAVAVPELRGMSTTLTTAVISDGLLTCVHVGDSRLYLVRGGRIMQLTKDHTVAAERVRLGLLSKERMREHEGSSILTRNVGRELIVSRDRLTRPLLEGDVLLLCSDGLHNVFTDGELLHLVDGRDAASACRALIDGANERGTADNVTAAVVRVVAPTGQTADEPGILDRLRSILNRERR